RLVRGGAVLVEGPGQPLVLGDRAGELRVERADPLAARALLLHHGKLVLFGELLEPLALDAMVVCEARALLFLLLKRGDQTLLLGAALVQLRDRFLPFTRELIESRLGFRQPLSEGTFDFEERLGLALRFERAIAIPFALENRGRKTLLLGARGLEGREQLIALRGRCREIALDGGEPLVPRLILVKRF